LHTVIAIGVTMQHIIVHMLLTSNNCFGKQLWWYNFKTKITVSGKQNIRYEKTMTNNDLTARKVFRRVFGCMFARMMGSVAKATMRWRDLASFMIMHIEMNIISVGINIDKMATVIT
jgi:hypothetical protein